MATKSPEKNIYGMGIMMPECPGVESDVVFRDGEYVPKETTLKRGNNELFPAQGAIPFQKRRVPC